MNRQRRSGAADQIAAKREDSLLRKAICELISGKLKELLPNRVNKLLSDRGCGWMLLDVAGRNTSP